MNKGLIIFTVLEFLALVLFLGIADASVATDILNKGMLTGALGVLIVGLFLEHIVAFNDFHKRSLFSIGHTPSLVDPYGLRKVPLFKLFLASVSESAVWAVWLLIAAVNPIVAFIVLTAGIFLQHNAEINIFIGRPTFEKFFSSRTLGFTLIESVSGAVWLAFVRASQPVVGPIVLAVGLLIEHMRQGKALAKADANRP